MTKRYITRQQHKSSCGPTAVINALKWLGYDVTYRDTINEFRDLGWTEDNAISCYDLRRSMNYFNIKYKLHKRTSVKDMEAMLDRGSSIIIAYDWMEYFGEGSHFAFITIHLGNYFGAHNYLGQPAGKKEHGFFNKDLMEAFLNYTKKERKDDPTSNKWMPCAWEILKNE